MKNYFAILLLMALSPVSFAANSALKCALLLESAVKNRLQFESIAGEIKDLPLQQRISRLLKIAQERKEKGENLREGLDEFDRINGITQAEKNAKKDLEDHPFKTIMLDLFTDRYKSIDQAALNFGYADSYTNRGLRGNLNYDELSILNNDLATLIKKQLHEDAEIVGIWIESDYSIRYATIAGSTTSSYHERSTSGPWDRFHDTMVSAASLGIFRTSSYEAPRRRSYTAVSYSYKDVQLSISPAGDLSLQEIPVQR